MKNIFKRKNVKSIIAMALALVMAFSLASYLGAGYISVSAKEPSIVKTPAVPLLHPYEKLTVNPNWEEENKIAENGMPLGDFRIEGAAIHKKISSDVSEDIEAKFFDYLQEVTGGQYRNCMFHNRVGGTEPAEELSELWIHKVFERFYPQYLKQYYETWSSLYDYYLKTGDYYFEDVLHLYLDIAVLDRRSVGDYAGEPYIWTSLSDIYNKALGTDGYSDEIFPLTDVKFGSWYWKGLCWAMSFYIVYGTEPHKFSPDRTCTNAEAITILWRTVEPENVGWDLPFDNVALSDYYFFPSKWAYDMGMVPGGSFDADKVCTRAMIVKYMWQAAGSPNVAYDGCFTDVPATADYATAVAWAVQNGIVTGTSPTTFAPDDPCTRAHVVTLMFRGYASENDKSYEFLDGNLGPDPYIQEGRN